MRHKSRRPGPASNSGPASPSASERLVRDIRRVTRKHHSAEDKIRIVLDGLRGEDGLASRPVTPGDRGWICGLDPSKFGTHSLRRTRAVLIYRRTGNLRAIQLPLGHSKVESTVRYLGINVDDAIEIAEKIDI